MFDMGKRICKLRRDAHLSQKQLGEKIGKSASTIGSYENGYCRADAGKRGSTGGSASCFVGLSAVR